MKYLGVPSSGSIAGTVYSHNRYGQYTRTRAIPVNPKTSAQGVVRNIFSTYSQGWAGLTSGQRAAWTAYAQDHPVLDRLGQSQILSGSAFYIRINGILVRAAGVSATDPPAGEPSFPALTIGGVPSAATQLWAATHPVMPTDYTMEVWTGRPRSAGRLYDADLRYLASFAPAATSPTALGATYTTKWGAFALGQRIFGQFRAVWHLGAASPWTGFYVDVGA